jgi:hypothetical protein
MNNTSDFSFYGVGRESIAQLAASSSSTPPNINEDWVSLPAPNRQMDFYEYLRMLAAQKAACEANCTEMPVVTIAEGDPDKSSEEMLKGLIIQMMKENPFLNELLDECVANEGEITIAQLRGKIEEYELNNNGFVMVDPSSPHIQMVTMNEEESEFAEFLTKLQEIQDLSGEDALLKMPQGGGYQESFITYEDIKRYCRMAVNSPLFNRENLQKAYLLYKGAGRVSKFVATGVAFYYSPWLTATVLLTRFTMRVLK